MEALAGGVERALGPLDAGRRRLYRAAAPRLGAWVLQRERRIVPMALLVALVALAGAVLAPLPMLALGPILLGVPHLLADLRYLVVQPGLHRRGAAVVLVGALLLATGTAGTLWPGLLGATLGVLLLARAPLWARVVAASPLALILAAAWITPRAVDLLFAHGHNLVAVGLWLAAAGAAGRAGARSRLLVALLFGALGAALALGAADGVLAYTRQLELPGGPRLRTLQRTLSPSGDPTLALRFVALYAYGQALHYGLWLRLIPEDVRPREAPRSFATSWQVLRAELGAPLLLVVCAGCVALALWAVADLAAARDGYLRLALFHGPLELLAAGVWALEGRRFLGGAR
jgi:hypothetical protein